MLSRESMSGAMQVAETLAKSALIPKGLAGKPADVLVVLLTGQELGLAPMQSLRNISVINGKGVMGAEGMVALCLRHRDVCQWFRLVESSDKVATYETQRAGSPEPSRLSYTIEQATRAGLSGGATWKAHTEAMLRARASAALARAVYPDLVGGLYDPDEAAEFDRPASRQTRKADQAPPHDVVTGEVIEAPTAPALSSGEPALVDQIAAALHEADTPERLRKVGGRIKSEADLSEADVAHLRGIYSTRQRELRQP